MPNDRIVALDMGTSKVRLLAADFDSGRLIRVVGFAEVDSSGVADGVIVDIYSAAKAVRQAVANLKRDCGLKFHNVVVGMTGRQIASLNAAAVVAVTRTSRRIAADDVVRVIDQAKIIVLPPDRSILNCLPRSYKVDGQSGITQPTGMYGNRLEVEAHIVTNTFSNAQNFAGVIVAAHLDMHAGLLSSIGAAECSLTTEEREFGVLLIDMGAGVTDISVSLGGSIAYSAVIPMGGDRISDDLAATLGISRVDAEHVKRKAEGNEAFTEIIQPRMETLLQLVRNELIKSGFYGLLARGVVLTGGGAKLCGVPSLTGRALKMPVRVGTPEGCDNLPEAFRSPEYATVYGLAKHIARNPPLPQQGYSNGIVDGIKMVQSFLRRFTD